MIIAETRMESMPDSCVQCCLFRASMMMCCPKEICFGREELLDIQRMRPKWCPLVEVEQRFVKVMEVGEE